MFTPNCKQHLTLQTIVDDVKMSLSNSDQSAILWKAKALASLGLLHNLFNINSVSNSKICAQNKEEVVTTKCLLKIYLGAAEVRIQRIMDTQLNAQHLPPHGLIIGMTSIVRLLQQIIVDVHLLFLSFHESVNPTATIITAENNLKAVGGLVPEVQRQMLVSIVQQMNFYCSKTKDTNKGNHCIEFDYDTASNLLVYGASSSSSTNVVAVTIQDQKKYFQKWLANVLSNVTAQCKAVLSSLSSAAEVAQLQQSVWRHCIYINEEENHIATANKVINGSTIGVNKKENTSNNMGKEDISLIEATSTIKNNKGSKIGISKSNNNTNINFSYSQIQWEAASAVLLATTQQQQASISNATATEESSSSSSIASTYLWSNAFRACFLHQVERLLKQSCNEVFLDTKHRILRALRQQGVVVDPGSLCVITAATAISENDANRNSTNFHVDDTRTKISNDYNSDACYLSSPTIYQFAERIRAHFENKVAQLLADIVNPVS